MSDKSKWDKAVKKTLMKLSERSICKHLILLSKVWDTFQYVFLSLSINLSCTYFLNKCLMICLYSFLTVWFILHFILHLFIMWEESLLLYLHLQINWLRLSAESDFNSERNSSLNLNANLAETEYSTEEENKNSTNFLINNVKTEKTLNRRDSS